MSKADEKILVIQLARMGDILQSTPLLAGLREHHPQAHICFLANDELREVVENNPCVDEVIGLKMRELSDFIDSPGNTLVEKYRLLKEEIQSIEGRAFDIVFNLNYTPLSILLSSLLDAREIRGYQPGSRGDGVIKDRWMNYLFALTSGRRLNRFNLVDIFAHSADAVPKQKEPLFKITKKDRDFARLFCEGHRISDAQPVIGLQVGAGSKLRCWPADYIANLAQLLVQRVNARVILFGSRSEAEVGRQIEVKSRDSGLRAEKLINAIGKTTIGQLAALLERCDLLITPDTGTMHLATAVGTKVLALFFASAYCYETGPYGDGNVVLQVNLPCSPCLESNPDCVDFRCRRMITPQMVLEVVAHWSLVTGHQSFLPSYHSPLASHHSLIDRLPQGIDLLRSQTDDWGVRYILLNRRQPTCEEIVALWYERMWKGLLDRNCHPDLENDGYASHTDLHSPELVQFTESVERVKRLLERGRRIEKFCFSKEQAEFEVAEIERLLTQEKNRCPWTAPLVDFYLLEKENLRLKQDGFWDNLTSLLDELCLGVRRLLSAAQRAEENFKPTLAGMTHEPFL